MQLMEISFGKENNGYYIQACDGKYLFHNVLTFWDALRQ